MLLLLATTTTINRLFRLQPHTANSNFDETDSVRKSKQTYSHLQAIHTYTCMSYNLVCSVLSNLTHFAKTYRSLKHIQVTILCALKRSSCIDLESFLLNFSCCDFPCSNVFLVFSFELDSQLPSSQSRLCDSYELSVVQLCAGNGGAQ